jgi:hypothetical protein
LSQPQTMCFKSFLSQEWTKNWKMKMKNGKPEWRWLDQWWDNEQTPRPPEFQKFKDTTSTFSLFMKPFS